MLKLHMHMIAGVLQYVAVASFAEAWIEILRTFHKFPRDKVASFAEAWIEITPTIFLVRSQRQSPPSRRRGLKYEIYRRAWISCRVASFAEAWIEIRYNNGCNSCCGVASFAEAWIEIMPQNGASGITYSRLLRGGVD